MKRKGLGRFNRFVKKPYANRVLALLLCAATLFGMMPSTALAETVVISGITAPDPAEYTVDKETVLADIELPDKLEITITEDGVSSVRKEPVEWAGEYDKDAAGEYMLTAAFADDTLSFSPMPTVRIIVKPAAGAQVEPAKANLLGSAQETGEGTMPSTEDNSTQDTDADEQPQILNGTLRGEGESGQIRDVNYSAVCKLIPSRPAYSTGESLQFTFNAQYATPGDPTKPQTVKFGIPIPETSPAVQLPMFYATGTGDYEGVPMYPLSYNGLTTELYLKTGSNGERWIEFTLDAGNTILGTLSMILPNGVSENVPAFTLMPEIISPGDYGTNTSLEGGTVEIKAEFGWNDVKKSANTDNIGVIGATTKDPDRITYSVTADSKSSGLDTGRIFTENYVLTDTIDLSGLHYDDGNLTQSEAGGISTFSIGGTPVLEIKAPLSALKVTKQVAGGQINAFNIEYTDYNTTIDKTDGSAKELSNLDLFVSLLLSAMKLNDGDEDALVTNTAVFDADSPYGDHHHSIASHTAYTQDRYNIEKAVYSDEACTIPATQVSADENVWYKIIVKNNGAGTGPFSITDELPAGMEFQSAAPDTSTQSNQTLTWNDVTIPSGQTHTIIVKAQFDATKFVSNPVHNTVVLRKDGQRLDSDYADVRYLAGVVDDASIIYEKSVNKTSAGENETLRYTISARNQKASTASKLITITDKWPGANVRPTTITGCTDYELLDAGGVSHTLEDVKTANPPIEITTIKLYNVLVPKGGTKATVYIDGVVTNATTELRNEIIGSAGQNLADTYSVGVGISKAPYKYDDINGIGGVLTNIDAVLADQIVCYQMTVRNLTDLALKDLTLTDKLPAGLTPVVGRVNGVDGQSVIKHGDNTYSAITLAPGTPIATYTPYTTSKFDLAGKETAVMYLFARVSAAAVDASNASNNCITNAAYVGLPNDLVTGDATANIYTYVDTQQAFYIKKSVEFVADFDDNLTTATTRLLSTGNDSLQWNKNDIVWNDAYVGYKMELINRNTTGVNKDPVRLYELIDTLPQGMEFVGVCIKGDSKSYKVANSAATSLSNLGSQLIRDGETGTWSNSQYSAQALTCHYDPDTNKVHITFNQDNSGVLSVKYHQDGANTELKPYIYVIARVKDDAKQTLFRNIVDAKVDANVELNRLSGDKTVSIRDGSGPDAGYKLISNYCDVNPVVFKPGIAKKFIGHYFPKGTITPETLKNEENLFPGETLRFQLQTGVGVVSGSVSNRVHANVKDFEVTDILPPEYVYRPGSATITLNAQWNTWTKALQTALLETVLPRGTVEPSIEYLNDGRTKLTWKFEGPGMRLFASTNNYSYLYYTHLITYDTDWNKDYVASYGNYTNYAAVHHSEDFSSVYSGTPDYDEKSVTASAVVNVFGAAGTSALKSVTNAKNETVSGNEGDPYLHIDGPGSEVSYTLRVANATSGSQNTERKALVLIDELPRGTDDTGVVNRVDRGSEFSVVFGPNPDAYVTKLVGSVEVPVNPLKYSVLYGDSVGRLNAAGDWSDGTAGSCIPWEIPSDGKNAIRIAFDPEFSLLPGEMLVVRFKAVACGDADAGETAWNSFGYSYRSLSGGKLSEKIYAEPQRVGIRVPGAAITVKKRVTGDAALDTTQFTFLLKQDGTPCANVKYTLSDSDAEYRTDADGSFAMNVTQTVVLSVMPGSKYSIEETSVPDDYTLVDIAPITTDDGAYDGTIQVFAFKDLPVGSSVGALCTNHYNTPPTRDLTVRKLWTGQFNTNQPTSVNVQLYKDGTAEGAPVVLNAGNLWKYTWKDLSTAEDWTVDELGAIPGYTKIITGDSINGFLITNDYTPAPVVSADVDVEKEIDGDANPPDETFRFRLTAVSYTAPTGSPDTMKPAEMPMPFGSLNGIKNGSITGAGSVLFGRFVFSKAGTYVYTIHEIDGINTLYTYDDSLYTLTYTVTSDINNPGRLTYNLVVTKRDVALDPPAVVFTNTYKRPTGELTVSKTVTGGGDVNALFTFRFAFSEPTRYNYVKSDGTIGTIATGESLQLKHNQSATITIYQGITYTVIEDAYTHYIPTPNDRTYSGTISATPETAAYTNRYDPPYVPTLTGDLTIRKWVTGDLGDRHKEFAFTITFNDPGSYQYTGTKSGTIKSGDMILLRHGEYITIVNLPAGTVYSVTESGNSGYRVYVSGDAGIIAANEVSVAAFTNSRSTVPLTGEDGALLTGIMLMLGALVGAAALMFAEKRLRHRRRRAKSAGKVV